MERRFIFSRALDWELAGSVLFSLAALALLAAILFTRYDRNLLLAAAALQAGSAILGLLAWLSRRGTEVEGVIAAGIGMGAEHVYGMAYEQVELAGESGDPTTDP